jgi:demethylspheroidene O-methyltransferase
MVPLVSSGSPESSWIGAIGDWFAARRNALLTNARFQYWATRFPLTRLVANRRARSVFDLVAGFVYSQILLACVRLKVFEHLKDGPLDSITLAGRLGLTREATERLLDAAVSLQLVERRSRRRFGLGPLGAPIVGNVAIQAMIEHHSMVYRDLHDPVALLRGERGDHDETGLAAYWPYAGADSPNNLSDERVAAYTALMSASQPLVTEEILDAYSFAGHQRLLDVGGGDGTFLGAVGKRYPHLELVLFDLPAVAERGRTRFSDAGFGDRARAYGGDFLADPLPAGVDAISFVRVIHDHDDERVRHILKAARKAILPGGVIVIAEPMAATPGAEPIGDAYFGFYLLAMGRGQARSAARLAGLLIEAGFEAPRLIPTRVPLQTSLMVARAGADFGVSHVNKAN